MTLPPPASSPARAQLAIRRGCASTRETMPLGRWSRGLAPLLGGALLSGTDVRRPVLFVLTGPELGTASRVSRAGTVLGRGEEADLRLTEDAVSRAHARVSAGEDGVYIEDLGTTNGTFVDGVRVEGSVKVADGALIQLGTATVVKLALMGDLEERALHTLHSLALRDPLTLVYNRRYFETRLDSEFSYAIRQHLPLAVLLFDLDDFKAINDHFGHQAGDVVLKLVATTVDRMTRPEDVLARYGGEEFIVLARDTALRNAEILAQRIRGAIEHLQFQFPDGPARITVSAGVAGLIPPEYPSPRDLVAAADTALYAAKSAGKNCVRSASTATPPHAATHAR